MEQSSRQRSEDDWARCSVIVWHCSVPSSPTIYDMVHGGGEGGDLVTKHQMDAAQGK